MPAPQLLPYSVQHENPSSVTAQDKTLTFPQSSWWSSSSSASVLGMVIRSTHQWIRDFHLSYWPCSSDALHPEMEKNQRKFCAADSVMCTWNQFRSSEACRDQGALLSHGLILNQLRVLRNCNPYPMAHGQVWLWQSPGQRDAVQICLSTDADPWVICACIATQPTGFSPKIQTLDNNRIEVKKASQHHHQLLSPNSFSNCQKTTATHRSIIFLDQKDQKLLINQRICLWLWPLFGHL